MTISSSIATIAPSPHTSWPTWRDLLNTEALDFIVVSVRTGNAIAGFLLPGDAVKYIAYRRSVEGPHGPAYDIQNADGSLVSYALDQQVAIANEGANPYRLVAENATAAEHFGASLAATSGAAA